MDVISEIRNIADRVRGVDDAIIAARELTEEADRLRSEMTAGQIREAETLRIFANIEQLAMGIADGVAAEREREAEAQRYLEEKGLPLRESEMTGQVYFSPQSMRLRRLEESLEELRAIADPDRDHDV